jgi:hypothetical protein
MYSTQDIHIHKTSIFTIKLNKLRDTHFGMNMTENDDYEYHEPNIRTKFIHDVRNEKYHINIFKSHGKLLTGFYGS